MRVRAVGMEGPEVEAALDRLEREDALGQLRRREGRAAELASDGGRPLLDWIDGLDRLLASPGGVEAVRRRALEVRGGAELVVWAGMGGSIQAVRCLRAPGVIPLDSTDPARLVRLWDETDGLRSTACLGVSMGMTSEEPLTHLRWFTEAAHGAAPAAVMTLPGSVLDTYARERGLRSIPLQPDGGSATPGRMSAPSTHVFLLPAAMLLDEGLEQALESIRSADPRPFTRLAAWLHTRLRAGVDKVLLDSSDDLVRLEPWIEQVVEESLGKGGRGALVFPRQQRVLLADPPDDCAVLRLGEDGALGDGPGLAVEGEVDVAVLGALMAGWCLAVALLGYLEGITFAGQPAVEAYKRYARELRDSPGDLPLPVPARPHDVAAMMRTVSPRGYLDLTLNADAETAGWEELAASFRRHANGVLRRPAKLRIAPGPYHSTEQAQVDGPPGVRSIRLVLTDRPPAPGAPYPARYLHAQALGTARAMADAGRPVTLIALRDESQLKELAEGLA